MAENERRRMTIVRSKRIARIGIVKRAPPSRPKNLESIGCGIGGRHDLHLERPRRILAAIGRGEQSPSMVIGVLASNPGGLFGGQAIYPPVGLLATGAPVAARFR